MKAYINGGLICEKCNQSMRRIKGGMTCRNNECKNSKKLFEMATITLKEVKGGKTT